MRRIRWKAICPHGEAMHASYNSRFSTASWAMHGHDFFEVFWIDSGVGRHRLSEKGEPQRLLSGDVCFIRRDDCHGFAAEAGSEPFALVNVAFTAEVWEDFRERYGFEGHPLFDASAASPPVLGIPQDLRREIAALFHDAVRRDAGALVRDAFLLQLAKLTGGSGIPAVGDTASAWLKRGLIEFERDRKARSAGVSALARQCGCSRTHLARVFREHVGSTPSAWLLELRLADAQRLLVTTGLSVTDVALESGFENLSHFHRCFARHFGLTPLRYRKKHQRSAL
jgi:AraC family transcriptional regulator, dual regulator of chb operon